MLSGKNAITFHNLMSSVDVQSEPSDSCSDISIQSPELSKSDKLEQVSSSSVSPLIESEGPFDQLREERSFSNDVMDSPDINVNG